MTVKDIMKKNGIDSFGTIPLSDCVQANQRLYSECISSGMKSVIIFFVPYKTGIIADDKFYMSAYARVYDYHKYFDNLFDSLIKDLKNEYPENTFKGFADHSPISEKLSAAKAGLGVIGKNTLLITKKYGSYVFIGSVVTDMEFTYIKATPKSCLECGKCAESCPGGAISDKGFEYEKCVSFISQKKVKTPEDDEIVKRNNTVWGCDICQEVCPMNNGIEFTNEKYFNESFLKNISYDAIKSMTDEEFAKYPFSWRKREVILHNLSLLENKSIEKKD